ncbi:MAG: DNA primase [Holosporales bacterium]|jgi:DNA primase|nr:DNA primase [Holosporales bacterium]
MSVTGINAVLGRIKDKLLLSEIVGKDTPLRKRGREHVGNCPFHSEKTGSFFVNDDKGTFYCFGCGASGDIIAYIMKKRGIQFPQAIEILAEMAGIKLPEKGNYSDDDSVQLKIMQKALEFFKAHLEGKAAEYCESRGIDKSCVEQFSIGYAPLNGNLLMSHLVTSGFEMSDILKSGLFAQRNGQSVCYFRDRIIFPVFNKRGWPIAFGGRALRKDSAPKYLNSPETALFQKRATLYAFNIASRNISKASTFILVEGYIDVIAMHQYGFNTTVASMGTSFSVEHLVKLWQSSDEPIICLDGDAAGYNAMVKIAFLAMQHLQPGKSLKFCVIPGGSDPDSFLQKFGKAAMSQILEKPINLIDFIWEHFVSQLKPQSSRTPEQTAKWKKDTLDSLNDIQDQDIRKLYRSDISSRIYQILAPSNKKKSPIHEFAQTPGNPQRFRHSLLPTINKDEKTLLWEATLLYILLERPSVIPCVIEELATIEFSRKGFSTIRDLAIDGVDLSDQHGQIISSEIQLVRSVASKNCDVANKDDEAVTELWRGMYVCGFSDKQQRADITRAKEDCNESMSTEAWDRLKELKISHIKNRQKDT